MTTMHINGGQVVVFDGRPARGMGYKVTGNRSNLWYQTKREAVKVASKLADGTPFKFYVQPVTETKGQS